MKHLETQDDLMLSILQRLEEQHREMLSRMQHDVPPPAQS
jgi:hypothetical protein